MDRAVCGRANDTQTRLATIRQLGAAASRPSGWGGSRGGPIVAARLSVCGPRHPDTPVAEMEDHQDQWTEDKKRAAEEERTLRPT